MDTGQRRESFIRPPEMEQFQVFRRTGLYLATAILAGSAAAALAVAAMVKDVAGLWGPAAVLGLLALVALPGILNARTPIFVADNYGVRMHHKDNWIGLLWREMGEVVVEPGNGLRNARIRITGTDAHQTYTSPVGFTTTASVAEAETGLARRRAAAAY